MQEDVRSAVPPTDHQEENALMFRRQSPRIGRDPRAITTMKKTYVDEQSRIAPKNLIAAHPVQGSQVGKGSGGTYSPAAPCA